MAIKRTPEEIEERINGIVASAEFENLESTEEDIKNLRLLGNGKISLSEYLKLYGIDS